MREPKQSYIPGFERVLSDAAELNTFTQGLRDESPRAVVLITMCAMDSLLGKLLKIRLDTSDMNSKQKRDLDGALKNFTSKTALAQGLGLVGKTEAVSLIALNEIRNKFAHAWDASFETDKIFEACEKLPITFTDELEQSVDQLQYDKFRYSVGSLLRDVISRCSMLEETGEVLAFSDAQRLHRQHVRPW